MIDSREKGMTKKEVRSFRARLKKNGFPYMEIDGFRSLTPEEQAVHERSGKPTGFFFARFESKV